MSALTNSSRSWSSFLPRHSIVMGLRANPPKPTPIPVALTSSVRLVFVGALAARELELLERMISAMGLKREAVQLCLAADLPTTLAAFTPEFIISLETPMTFSGARGEWTGENVRNLTTWHPSHLIETPAAKKEAWQDLQRVARALGTLA